MATTKDDVTLPFAGRAADDTVDERETLDARFAWTLAWQQIRGAERYESRATLGEGGMGEVRLCLDRRIGRQVAMKVVRHATDLGTGGMARFLREAFVQGQLEHPSIVPVYDVGSDDAGAPYFTMRRVRGDTLESLITENSQKRRLGPVSEQSRAAQGRSRRSLLAAFGSVCLAVHYAHTRGVVHRDLKPSNVMLGDFGEVYVLDWGVAKLLAGTDLEAAPGGEEDRRPEEKFGATEYGAMVGTPGYMAPEQARGESIDARADIYSLGAILFEILALEPLHTGLTPRELVASTIIGADARVSVRAPDAEVPPELEAVCVRATASDREARYVSAREIHDAIERFLEGDRDLERRRELSEAHVRLASRSIEASAKDTAGSRGVAIREIGRALALDPDNTRAADLLVRLLTERPKAMPPDAEESMMVTERALQKVGARTGALACLNWFMYVPLWIWMGIRSVPAFVVASVAWIAASAVAFMLSQRTTKDGMLPYSLIATTLVAVACSGVIFGPLVTVPGLAATMTLGLSLARMDRARRVVTLVLAPLTIVVPFALQMFGVLPASYLFEGGKMCVLPSMSELPRVPTLTFLVLEAAIVPVVCWFHGGRFRAALTNAHHDLHLYAWQLRQLVPNKKP